MTERNSTKPMTEATRSALFAQRTSKNINRAAGVIDAILVYLYICFQWISGSDVVIIAELNDKSDV